MQIEKIINAEIEKILNEDIYGNLAIVYHRTTIQDLINKVYTEGFKIGKESMYGNGFYATYDLKSQESQYMSDMYGNILVKFSVPINNFFICDYSEFIKSYQAKNIKNYNEKNFIIKQMGYFKIPLFDFIDNDYMSPSKLLNTSHIVRELLLKIPNFTKYVDGVIFTGQYDGKVLVCYKPNQLIIPISYKIDGENTFTKVDYNMNHLHNVLKNKTR